MRLIDADAIKEKIDDIWDGRPLSFLGARILAMIDHAPTIDAVSVVRCKECKYYAEHNELYINAPTNCVKHSTINHYVAVKADDFCSYGERSDT